VIDDGASIALITLLGTFVGPGSIERYSMCYLSVVDVGFIYN